MKIIIKDSVSHLKQSKGHFWYHFLITIHHVCVCGCISVYGRINAGWLFTRLKFINGEKWFLIANRNWGILSPNRKCCCPMSISISGWKLQHENAKGQYNTNTHKYTHTHLYKQTKKEIVKMRDGYINKEKERQINSSTNEHLYEHCNYLTSTW